MPPGSNAEQAQGGLQGAQGLILSSLHLMLAMRNSGLGMTEESPYVDNPGTWHGDNLWEGEHGYFWFMSRKSTAEHEIMRSAGSD